MNAQQNNVPSLKGNETAGYKGPVKIELLKGAGLLVKAQRKYEGDNPLHTFVCNTCGLLMCCPA